MLPVISLQVLKLSIKYPLDKLIGQVLVVDIDKSYNFINEKVLKTHKMKSKTFRGQKNII